MLAAVAFCPHPPLILPEIASAAAVELDPLRAACARALAVLRDLPVHVVGGAEATTTIPAGGSGRLAGYGVDRVVPLGAGPLPLSIAVGAWLAEQAGIVPAAGQAVAGDASPQLCAELGARLAGRAQRVGLLVMGDGSARRDTESPGYLDERARPFDQEVARLVGTADTAGLLALDPTLAADLLVAGRAAWQVAAGACDQPMRAELLYDDAPYGVHYFVATWVPA